MGSGGGSIYVAAPAAAITPLALAAMAPPHFDPVPVFIGPKPGWTGAVAAARPVDGANPATATPPQTTAYAPVDKPPTIDPNETPALTAPLALHIAIPPGVKPVAAKVSARSTTGRIVDRSKPKAKGVVIAAHAKPAAKSEAARPASVPARPPGP